MSRKSEEETTVDVEPAEAIERFEKALDEVAKPEAEVEPLKGLTYNDKLYGYDVLEWNGMPNYRCQNCPWDTVEADAIERMFEHIYKVHIAPLAQALAEG